METIKVSEAKYLKDYCINFTFNDGTEKNIDLKNELWGTIFSPLNDKEFFQNFKINDFTIEWMNGADFSPEFLYNCEESIS